MILNFFITQGVVELYLFKVLEVIYTLPVTRIRVKSFRDKAIKLPIDIIEGTVQ
jgi:hypothetical protein